MEDLKEISTQFEAVKLSMRHTKDGHCLTLAINPHDTPHELLQDYLGQRYQVVMVRIGEEGQPVASAQKEEGRRAVNTAAALCKDPQFQSWLAYTGNAEEIGEEHAVKALREMLKVKSRSELMNNAEARKTLAAIRDEFAASFRRR